MVSAQDELLQDIVDFDIETLLVDENQLRDVIDINNNTFSIMHINIRSVCKNYDHLILLLESFDLYFVDVIVLSETFQILGTDCFNIHGYEVFYNGAKYNRNDGVMVYVKSTVQPKYSSVTLPNSKATISRVIYQTKTFAIGISAIYKPPPIPKNTFIQDIEDYLETLDEQQMEIFIGDTNINILDTQDNNVHNYLSLLAHMGYISHINSITRPDSKTTLDHLFVKSRNKPNLQIKSLILDSHITDHLPIMLCVDLANKPTDTDGNIASAPFTIPQKKLDIKQFKLLLSEQDWDLVTQEKDPELATNNFIETLKSLKIKAEREYAVYKIHKKNKKWITNGIINSIKKRDKMKRRLINNYTVNLESRYKTYRNLLNKIITKQKRDYYRHQLNQNKKDLRKMYEVVKDITNERNVKKEKRIIIHRDNDEEFQDDLEMADYCNDYFTNIGIKMEEQIPLPSSPVPDETPNLQSLYLSPATENEIIKHINELKTKSAPGVDSITAKEIKDMHVEIMAPLIYVINLIFQTGKIPTIFKTSIVSPIYKSGSKTNIGNYRPISLVTCFAKVFEKCLKDRLLNFLLKCNILNDRQYGFMQGRSTADALHHFTSEITGNLNLGEKSIGVFIDLAKAFDTVKHKRLLDILEQYGIRGKVYNLMVNYLEDRQQKVKINNVLSSARIVKIGVPQGTVLGPILFIIYINSLLRSDIHGSIISYADDTALIFKGRTWEEARENSIRGLMIIKNWLETYKLTLNITKTNYIAFSITRADRPTFSSIPIDKTQISEVSQIKYLGIIIDQFLKWQPHIDYLANKIRLLIYKFYIIRDILCTADLILVYKSLVESLIRYGILVWGGLYKNALYKLNIVQKFILRIIYRKNKRYPSRLLYTEQTTNIRTLYLTTICSFVRFKNTIDNYVSHAYNTRSKINKNLKIPDSQKNINLKYLNYLAPKSYNLLPGHIRELKIKKKFDKACTKYVIENYDTFALLFD